MTTKEFIAAIEIGSSKIAGMVGRKDSNGNLEVLAYATEDSSSFIRKGIIFNIDKAVIGVKSIINNLETYLDGFTISKIYVTTCGQSFRALKNVVKRDLPENVTISQELIDSIYEEDRAINLPDLDIFEVVPLGYQIGTIKVMDAIGVIGNHIEGTFLNIVGRSIILKNLKRCFTDTKVIIADDPGITPLITAKYVLTESERRLGCALIDFGADTTTVSIYHKNKLKFMVVIPIGGSSITHDLMSLNIDEDEAEELKVHYGSAILEQKKEDEETIHLSEEGHSVKLSEINNIVEARATEIIANVWNQIEQSGYSTRLGSGLIFTGGGSNLRNLSTAFNKFIKRNPKIRTAQLVYEPSISGTAIPTDGTINALIGMVLEGTENCCERLFTQPIAKTPQEPVKTPIDTDTDDTEVGGLVVEEDDNEDDRQTLGIDEEKTEEDDEISEGKKDTPKSSFFTKIFGPKGENKFEEDPEVVAKRENERKEMEIIKQREMVEKEAQREVQRTRRMEQKKKDDAIRAKQEEKYRAEQEKKREEDQKRKNEEKELKEKERIQKEADRKKKRENSKVKKAFSSLTNILFNDDPMNEDND